MQTPHNPGSEQTYSVFAVRQPRQTLHLCVGFGHRLQQHLSGNFVVVASGQNPQTP